MTDFINGVLWGTGFTLMFVWAVYRPVIKYCIRKWQISFLIVVQGVPEEVAKAPQVNQANFTPCIECGNRMREEYIKAKIG